MKKYVLERSQLGMEKAEKEYFNSLEELNEEIFRKNSDTLINCYDILENGDHLSDGDGMYASSWDVYSIETDEEGNDIEDSKEAVETTEKVMSERQIWEAENGDLDDVQLVASKLAEMFGEKVAAEYVKNNTED